MLAKWPGCITLLSEKPSPFFFISLRLYPPPPPFDDFSASKERANCINYLEKPGKKGSSIDIHIQISNFSTSRPFSSFIVDSSSVENGGSRGEIRNRPTITRGIYTWKERDRVIDVGPTLARALTINYRDSIRN